MQVRKRQRFSFDDVKRRFTLHWIRRLSACVCLLAFTFQLGRFYELQTIDSYLTDAPVNNAKGIVNATIATATNHSKAPSIENDWLSPASLEIPSPTAAPTATLTTATTRGNSTHATKNSSATSSKTAAHPWVAKVSLNATSREILVEKTNLSSSLSSEELEPEEEIEPEPDWRLQSSDSEDDGEKNPTETSTKKFRLFQVINTFATNKDKADDRNIIHQPYDQWSTLLSIQRARQRAPPNLEVTLVCAMFESDLKILSRELNSTCDVISVLERSTITEYGSGEDVPNPVLNLTEKEAQFLEAGETLFRKRFSKRELPFLQDLLDAGVSTARGKRYSSWKNKDDDGSNDDFYVMLTNSDIGLTKDFYSLLSKLLRAEQKSYTINRWSIPMEGKNHTIKIREPSTDQKQAKRLLDQIDASLPTGESHPGYDCFIIHSSIMGKINMGKMYAGFPPWGSVLKRILKDIGDYKFKRSSLTATFHLGDRGTWSTKKESLGSTLLLNYLKGKYQADIHYCPKPIFGEDPMTVLNAVNCGRVWRDVYLGEPRVGGEESTRKKRRRKRNKESKKRQRTRQQPRGKTKLGISQQQ